MSNAVAEIVMGAGPNSTPRAWSIGGVRSIIPIILLVIGIGIIASARKGQMSQNAMTIRI
jgi:hypothetical protein